MVNQIRKLIERWSITDRFVPESKTFDYSPVWVSHTRPKCLKLCDRCCLHPWKEAKIVHHLKYKRSNLRIILGYIFLGHDFGRSISGYEIPGWDIVPVSTDAHHNSYGASSSPNSVHFTGTNPHWIKHPHSIDNHQSFKMKWRLRITFFLLIGGWVVLIFPIVAIAVYLLVSRL